jgi:Rer1 family
MPIWILVMLVNQMKAPHCRQRPMKSSDPLFDDCRNLSFGEHPLFFFFGPKQATFLAFLLISHTIQLSLFRYSTTKAIFVALVCSFFSVFDIPVFWPILLIYFCILFAITMRRQIKHMIKYKYVPFDLGKKNYGKSNK